jgi:hypothetical protein
MRRSHFCRQILFQHIQNCRRRLILLLRLRHPVEYSHKPTIDLHLILGMTFHFIATQDLDGPFEFLVHIFRGFRFRISSGAKGVVDCLQRTVKEIVRKGAELEMIRCRYVLSLASESGVCSCAWTKVRQRETSSIACFRYTLPIFFIYLTNESLSKGRAATAPGRERDLDMDQAKGSKGTPR